MSSENMIVGQEHLEQPNKSTVPVSSSTNKEERSPTIVKSSDALMASSSSCPEDTKESSTEKSGDTNDAPSATSREGEFSPTGSIEVQLQSRHVKRTSTTFCIPSCPEDTNDSTTKKSGDNDHAPSTTSREDEFSPTGSIEVELQSRHVKRTSTTFCIPSWREDTNDSSTEKSGDTDDAPSTTSREDEFSPTGSIEVELRSRHVKRTSTTFCMLPYGLTILTLVYVIVTLVLQYVSPVDCLQEPCSSEGVNTSVLTFGTAFMTSMLLMVSALHLQCRDGRSSVHGPAILAQWSMAMAFVFIGMGHTNNSNSGFDDNVGEKHFYVTWTLVYGLMIVSVEELYRWSRNIIVQYNDLFERSCQLRFMLLVCFLLTLVTGLLNFGGYIWCSREESIHTTAGVIDEIDPIDDKDDLHLCLWMTQTVDKAWWASFAIFMIPFALVFRKVIVFSVEQLAPSQLAQPCRGTVWGLSNLSAAHGLLIVPWTFGGMLHVWTVIAGLMVGDDDADGDSIFDTIHGHVLVNYGILITYFFLHNLAMSLPKQTDAAAAPPPPHGKEDLNHGDTDEEYDEEVASSSQEVPCKDDVETVLQNSDEVDIQEHTK